MSQTAELEPALQALKRDIAGAADPQIMRIVAMVDAMGTRGPMDQLIAPLRRRLLVLRPPRPLRFDRLMFHPLDPLIVPAMRWRWGRHTIPRSVLTPMSRHVHRLMGEEAQAIEAELAGKTTADQALIGRLGQRLWPRAAAILAETKIFESWDITGLGDRLYRPLANLVAALLAEAAPLDALCTETAEGLLPPRPEAVGAMLGRTAAAHPAALPMLIVLLLTRLPQAAAFIRQAPLGSSLVGIRAATVKLALEQAADRLLRQLIEDEATEAALAAGSLADAGAATRRILTLLEQLACGTVGPRQREQMRLVRQRLDGGCQARFATGLQEDLLAPLRYTGPALDAAAVGALEQAARGLRMLAFEARPLPSGGGFEPMLIQAATVIRGEAMRDRLTLADQVRLVEILSGPEAALALVG